MKLFGTLPALLISISFAAFSCKKESAATSSDKTSEITLKNLRWKKSGIDSGVALELPPFPTEYSNVPIAGMYLFDDKWRCAPTPTGGTYCFTFGQPDWIRIEKDGTEKGRVFYRIFANSIILYVRASEYINTIFYTNRKDQVKVRFLN